MPVVTKFLPEADKEFIEAALWYEEKSLGLGNSFIEMVEKKVEFNSSLSRALSQTQKQLPQGACFYISIHHSLYILPKGRSSNYFRNLPCQEASAQKYRK